MSKKVYLETAKKWAINAGYTGFSIIGLYLMYSVFIGAITIDGYSGDQVCGGYDWDNDPCYAYVNFTANEDTFWYPVKYDPWGRNTPFKFDPNIKDWKLQRSWGKGWRDLPMDTGCTGTWCGGLKGTTYDNPATYSVAWRKGKSYQIRIVALKNNPFENIKWWIPDLKVPDPLWKGIPLEIESPCIRNTTIETKEVGDCWNNTYEYEVSCDVSNSTCLVYENGTTYNFESYQWQQCNYTYTYETVCAEHDSRQHLHWGNNYILTKEELGIYCSYDEEDIVCDQCGNDGNCDGTIQLGETSAVRISPESIKFNGFNKDMIKKKFITGGLI